MSRSTPDGRGGLDGSAPAAMRSVHSAKYLMGAEPNWPAMMLTIVGPDCPDCTRRAQASSDDSNLPSIAGMVRVAISPSWWQPTQPLFFMALSQSDTLILAGMSLLPPN